MKFISTNRKVSRRHKQLKKTITEGQRKRTIIAALAEIRNITQREGSCS